MVRTRRRRRPRPSILRWLAAALSMVLVLGVLARGHIFQALDIPFGCEHPAANVVADQQDDNHGAPGDSDCPPDCHRCPCGQIPMVPPVELPLPYVELEPYELDYSIPRDRPGQSLPHRLDRPPRRPLV